MTHQEIIQNLKACSTGDPSECHKCSMEYDCGCSDRLMAAAANMLEADAQPQKTADEMFRELGYERAYKGFVSVTYQKIEPYVDLIIEVNTAHKIVNISNGYESYTIPFDIFKAGCKLLDEIGVE